MLRSRYCFCVLCALTALILAALLFALPQPAVAQEVKPVSFINWLKAWPEPKRRPTNSPNRRNKRPN